MRAPSPRTAEVATRCARVARCSATAAMVRVSSLNRLRNGWRHGSREANELGARTTSAGTVAVSIDAVAVAGATSIFISICNYLCLACRVGKRRGGSGQQLKPTRGRPKQNKTKWLSLLQQSSHSSCVTCAMRQMLLVTCTSTSM